MEDTPRSNPRPADVDAYLRDGCGRCALYTTPRCKVHRWKGVLEALRTLVREHGLVEEVKWGSPCYTLGGKNVVMVAATNEACVLSFFRGAALEDVDALTRSPGPNSRLARLVEFRSAAEVASRRDAVARLIDQAIALERSGKGWRPEPAREPRPEELERRLAADPALGRAFAALSPGRQRSHVLYVAGAKQSATRERRVDRCVALILAGRGFGER